MRKFRLTPVLAALVLLIGYFFTSTGDEPINPAEIIKLEDIPEQITRLRSEGMAANKYINTVVTKVVDGDTLEVSYKGKAEKVRLLCIDTPESVKQGIQVQEYSKEAADFTRKLTLDKNVKLIFDKGLRDRYGRLLAYVVLEDGTFVNGLIVRNGFARVEIVSPNSSLSEYFFKLQDRAIKDKLGVWGLPQGNQPFVKDSSGKYIPKYKASEKKAS